MLVAMSAWVESVETPPHCEAPFVHHVGKTAKINQHLMEHVAKCCWANDIKDGLLKDVSHSARCPGITDSVTISSCSGTSSS